MRMMLAALTAIVLLAGVASTNAQGVSDQTPGHKMQQKGSIKGEPGASGYAPGHLMQDKGSVKGTTGASGYAPGHKSTTGVRSKTDIDTKSR